MRRLKDVVSLYLWKSGTFYLSFALEQSRHLVHHNTWLLSIKLTWCQQGVDKFATIIIIRILTCLEQDSHFYNNYYFLEHGGRFISLCLSEPVQSLEMSAAHPIINSGQYPPPPPPLRMWSLEVCLLIASSEKVTVLLSEYVLKFFLP